MSELGRELGRMSKELGSELGRMLRESMPKAKIIEKEKPRKSLLGEITFGTATVGVYQVNTKEMETWIHAPKPFRLTAERIPPHSIRVRARLP